MQVFVDPVGRRRVVARVLSAALAGSTLVFAVVIASTLLAAW